jgi:hypothetical protein
VFLPTILQPSSARFPVTLYYEQWVRLLDSADRHRAFLEENKSKLKFKSKE